MVVKVTSKRQVTFPKAVMERLHIKAGDTLTLEETKNGILIKRSGLSTDHFAPLRHLIAQDLPPLDMEKLREDPGYADPRLRD